MEEIINFKANEGETVFERLRVFLQHPSRRMRESAAHQFLGGGFQLTSDEERALVAAGLNCEELLIEEQYPTRRLLAGKRRFDPDFHPQQSELTETYSIDRAVFEIGFTAKDKFEAIPKMVHAMYLGSKLSREVEERIVTALIRREGIISTGFRGIAVPHASFDYQHFVLGYFHAEPPIPWDSTTDNEPVRYVICHVEPQGQYQKHIRVLVNVARILLKEEFRHPPPKTLEEWRARIGFFLIEQWRAR